MLACQTLRETEINAGDKCSHTLVDSTLAAAQPCFAFGACALRSSLVFASASAVEGKKKLRWFIAAVVW